MLERLFRSESEYTIDEKDDTGGDRSPCFEIAIFRPIGFDPFSCAIEVVVAHDTDTYE